MIKERPILFSAPMVRALLDGRKTQTRRVAKLTANAHVKEVGGHRRWHPGDPEAKLACPYGQLGEHLWVRETCFINDFRGVKIPESERADCQVVYKADPLQDWEGEQSLIVWRPSIHMPRWASRITLEITGVRLERLLDISEADAIAEGIERQDKNWWKNYTALGNPLAYTHLREARTSYCSLWVSINGPRSWDLNPLVWVVEFKVIKP